MDALQEQAQNQEPDQEQNSERLRLYRIYWKLYLTDLAAKLGVVPTERVKKQLHKEFKDYLGYKSTSNMTADQMSLFLYEVLATAASEKGIYIRSSLKQPQEIQEMDLKDCWKFL